MTDDARPRLLIVCGAPGTGKTTLARMVAEAMYLPLIVRDEIKQGMHVTVGSTDPDERGRFGDAAFQTFYRAVAGLLDDGVSVVAEAAFHGDRATADLTPLVERSQAAMLVCRADSAIARRRYAERAAHETRHPAHDDAGQAARMLAGTFLWDVYEPPRLDIPRLDIETTDGYAPDWDVILAFARDPRGGSR